MFRPALYFVILPVVRLRLRLIFQTMGSICVRNRMRVRGTTVKVLVDFKVPISLLTASKNLGLACAFMSSW